MRAKGWIGCVHLKHALPAEHLTIECRMNEQKKEPPLTHSQKASGGRVVGLSLVWNQRQPSRPLRYHNGGGGWKAKRTGVNGPQNNDRHKQICGHQRCGKRRDIVPWYTTTRTCL